jgi:hypothetical protein
MGRRRTMNKKVKTCLRAWAKENKKIKEGEYLDTSSLIELLRKEGTVLERTILHVLDDVILEIFYIKLFTVAGKPYYIGYNDYDYPDNYDGYEYDFYEDEVNLYEKRMILKPDYYIKEKEKEQ